MQQIDSQTRLKSLLRELFQLDVADLDFGLYRLFRLKRDEVEAFLNKLSEATPGTPVDEEPHDPGIRTASSESWAITAWAYARQARMSSGSRSG